MSVSLKSNDSFNKKCADAKLKEQEHKRSGEEIKQILVECEKSKYKYGKEKYYFKFRAN